MAVPSARPLSAFEARKTSLQKSHIIGIPKSIAYDGASRVQHDEVLEPTQRARKRQKFDKNIRIEPEDIVAAKLAVMSTPTTENNFGSSEIATLVEGLAVDQKAPLEIVRPVSNFIPSTINFVRGNDEDVLMLLKGGEYITVLGQYDLWVRKGSVKIYGAILHAGPRLHRIYTPSSTATPSIQHTNNPYGPVQVAEIVLRSCATGIRPLGKLSPKFHHIWGPAPLTGEASHTLLSENSKNPSDGLVSLLTLNSTWRNTTTLLTEIQEPRTPVVLVCGPASTGKSSFCRYITNSFLSGRCASSGIAYLDLDPGQPEYSPPGDISLCHLTDFNLGPPLSHPMVSGGRTLRSHAIGALTPRDDPNHYLRCISDLFIHYQNLERRQSGCPLIVNCCGWVQGAGLEVLRDIALCISPTEIIYTSTLGPVDVVAMLQSVCSQNHTRLHILESQSSKSSTTRRTPADSRLMQTMSYFHLDVAELGKMRWNPAPIHTLDFARLTYDGDDPDIVGIYLYGDDLDPDVVEDVVEGSVLSLVAVEDEDILPRAADIQHTKRGLPYIYTRTSLDPLRSHSIGQVLVWQIDMNTKQLLVTTPAVIDAHRSRGLKLVLVRGKIDIPTWAYQEEYYLAKHRDKPAHYEGDGEYFDHDGTSFDDVVWADKTAWVDLVVDHDTARKRGKVLRVRRNLETADRGK